MAGALNEAGLARQVFSALQAAACPYLERLNLQESVSMLELLCSPSELRTAILTWLCSSIHPKIDASGKDQQTVMEEMAALGHELLLCKENDMALIRGDSSPRQQLLFLQQLASLVLDRSDPDECSVSADLLMNELFSAENHPRLSQVLEPTLDPRSEDAKSSHKSNKLSSSRTSANEDVSDLLQSTRSALEQLKSECEFLSSDHHSPPVFSPSALHVAADDLQQLMTTFSHVYETELATCCKRDPPKFDAEMKVFPRVHQLLQACLMDLEMLSQLSETSESITEDIKQLPGPASRGEERTLSEQLLELSKRYTKFVSQLDS
ncbi:HAUS augmin-like complex subunit 7 [Synchiropus splendidus]|uniref:HAUS augmin-like complex subunit 7 n=1 Tax=Synchiropus splendidus TaxID=270530 RepID=UPI00237E5915|nr:HAUS augmin-like complex subunit 7 [Synchiropus splendidus]